MNRLWVAYNEFFQYMREMREDSVERLSKEDLADDHIILLG